MFYIFWVLLGPGRASAARLSPSLGKSYIRSTGFLVFLWTLYPLVWGLADGGNVISCVAIISSALVLSRFPGTRI